MIRILLTCVVICLASFNSLFSQSKIIDSLKTLLNGQPHDSIVIKVYNDLCYEYMRINTDTSLYYANLSLKEGKAQKSTEGIAKGFHSLALAYYSKSSFLLARDYFDKAFLTYDSLNNRRNMGAIKNNLGVIYKNLSEYDNALKHQYQALALYKEINYVQGTSSSYINIGATYEELGEYDSALNNYIKSMEIKLAYGDSMGLAKVYNNIGFIKSELKEYESAQEYYSKAIAIREILNDLKGLASCYTNLGILYLDQKEYDNAQIYFKNSLGLYNKINEPKGKSNSYMWLGVIAMNSSNHDQAINYYNQSMNIKIEIADMIGQSGVLNYMSKVYQAKNDSDGAVLWANKSLQIAQDINAKVEARNAAEMLNTLFLEAGDDRKAYTYLRLYYVYKDSILNDQKVLELSKLEAKLAVNQLKMENELLQKEKIINDSALQESKYQIENQKIVLIALVISLFLALGLAFFWFRYYKQKQKSIIVLEELNNEIKLQKQKITEQSTELKTVNDKISAINDSLEDTIKERTEKIQEQNEKLRRYAFSNSHKVRAPLARLLGLANLSQMNAIDSDEREEVNKKLLDAAKELDDIVHGITEILGEEENP